MTREEKDLEERFGRLRGQLVPVALAIVVVVVVVVVVVAVVVVLWYETNA
jgi:hypothetical protein